jgi:hypothetical protein
MRKCDVINEHIRCTKEWAVRFIKDDLTVSNLRSKFDNEDIVEILRYAADFIEVDHKVKDMFINGESIWNE